MHLILLQMTLQMFISDTNQLNFCRFILFSLFSQTFHMIKQMLMLDIIHHEIQKTDYPLLHIFDGSCSPQGWYKLFSLRGKCFFTNRKLWFTDYCYTFSTFAMYLEMFTYTDCLDIFHFNIFLQIYFLSQFSLCKFRNILYKAGCHTLLSTTDEVQ